MLYAILCYNFEDVVGAWSPAEDAAVMARLRAVEAGLTAAERMGAVARLLPTTAAVTLRKGRDLLNGAGALTQFFDRDTSEDLAVTAMKGFQEFMLQPERLPEVLSRIERARERIYGPLPRRATVQ